MSKNKRWKTILDQTRIPSLNEIERGILAPVQALRKLGIPTTASCEGHLGSETPFPWIEVAIPTGGNAFRTVRVTRLLLLEAERSLWRALDQFYAANKTPFSARLHIFFFKNNRWGVFYLQSIGAQMIEGLSQRAQAKQLMSSRREFKAFARFLRRHYLS